MLFSGFASNSNLNGIGASINGTRYMDETTGSGLYNFFGGTIAEILLYNSFDQTLRESVIDFIDNKYSTNYGDDYTGYFGKQVENTWAMNEWEESPMSSNSQENNIMINQNSSSILIKFDVKVSNYYQINMYDLKGQLIKNIFNGELDNGLNKFEKDIDQISSGTYIIEVKSSNYFESKNFIIVK